MEGCGKKKEKMMEKKPVGFGVKRFKDWGRLMGKIIVRVISHYWIVFFLSFPKIFLFKFFFFFSRDHFLE